MCAHDCIKLLDGFSLAQKTVLRLLLAAFLAVGACGVFLQSALWGWVYLGVVISTQFFMVLPTLCGHCPYPRHHDDCLFLPAGLMRRLVKYRGPAISRGEVVQMGLALLAAVLLPQYWLSMNPPLFVSFWVLALAFLASFPFYLCKRCRHRGCPANRVKRIHLAGQPEP
ncbi:hypothetical protein AAU61_03135 [Desulfocarbo indianensis]|nr:hypothetical protein AAU61_03135 [Desulfocarbo indianensis]